METNAKPNFANPTPQLLFENHLVLISVVLDDPRVDSSKSGRVNQINRVCKFSSICFRYLNKTVYQAPSSHNYDIEGQMIISGYGYYGGGVVDRDIYWGQLFRVYSI